MTPLAWALAALIVVIATAVQAGTGLGFGIVAVPLLAIGAPGLGIGAVLTLTVLVMVAVAWAERHWLRLGDLTLASAAAVPGLVAGTALAGVLPPASTHVAIGAVVVAASGAALTTWTVRTTPASLAIAGALGGLLTPVAALPGPPMALAYRPDDVRTMRATLSAYFAVASTLSLASLSLAAGDSGVATLGRDMLAGAGLAPAVIAGAAVAAPVVRSLSPEFVRRAALVLSLVSGAALVARGVAT
ncbi:TSUP family transporter [Demequina pelophila]|uniref:TSUP family transporter n=1 Tax=Demequina pelophila TaxID=1638984 RepID=UPI00078149AF|nr:TSUP family transporter [Demequina pelophila]